jgi:hypothetical protein
MKLPRHIALLLLTLLLTPSTTALADAVISDGSLGALNPTGSQVINLDNVAPDGVLNYTTIDIPPGVTISFNANASNTPVFMAATGLVVIDGIVEVSAGHFSTAAGPGGGAGGLAGSGASAGSDGSGPAPGEGGLGSTGLGNAGGGGGMASPGLVATSRSGGAPAAGGPAISPIPLLPDIAGGGGSGGGGGGGRNQCIGGCVALTGGVGGGGGGGLQVATPDDLILNGSIRANGGHGGWAFANILGHAGPGGGGSGGYIELYANRIEIGPAAVLEAVGGAGGGLSTEPVPNDPYFFSSGANGGEGYLLFGTSDLELDPAATIAATLVVDDDSDGVTDGLDNCLEVANPTQLDSDGDGYGNACDADLNNDCVVNSTDLGIFKSQFFTAGPDADFNGDATVNAIDLGILRTLYFAAPGPGQGACER